MREFSIEQDQRVLITHGNTSSSVVYLSGNFDGATLQLQYVDIDGTFINLTDGVFTENMEDTINHGVGMDIYANITGSGSSTKINIRIARDI